MKRFKGALLGLMLLPVLALAETRMVTVDMEGVIANSEQAKAFREQLRKDFSEEEAQLRKLSEEGNALKEKLNKEGDFLSAEDKQALVGQVQKKYEEFQRLGARVKQSSQERERDFLEQLRPQVETILQQLVSEEKYDIILNRRSTIYSTPELDISGKVLELLNKQK